MNDFDHFADPHLRELAAALHFSPDDLALNTEGQLSASQIAQLCRDLGWQYWPGIAVCGLFALLMGVNGLFGGAAVFMVAALVLAGVLRLERDRLPEKPVRTTMLNLGRINLGLRRFAPAGDSSTGRTYFPVADGQQVYAPHRLYRALRANQEYRVIYGPFRTWGGYRMLAIEPLDTAGKRHPAKDKR